MQPFNPFPFCCSLDEEEELYYDLDEEALNIIREVMENTLEFMAHHQPPIVIADPQPPPKGVRLPFNPLLSACGGPGARELHAPMMS